MADTQETIADIIAEMETERPGLMNAPINTNNSYYARRLKAALKSKRGNAAKLREALEFIKQYFDKIDPFNINTYTFSQIEVEHINEAIDAALAAPPRNCDIVPNEAPKAADMFHRERPLHGYDYETHEWLLAPATEKEGDAK